MLTTNPVSNPSIPKSSCPQSAPSTHSDRNTRLPTRSTSLLKPLNKLGLIVLAAASSSAASSRVTALSAQPTEPTMRKLKLLDFDLDFSMPTTERAYCNRSTEPGQTDQCAYLTKSPARASDFSWSHMVYTNHIHQHFNSANNNWDSDFWQDDDYYCYIR